jgi:hypothetical protein
MPRKNQLRVTLKGNERVGIADLLGERFIWILVAFLLADERLGIAAQIIRASTYGQPY